MANGVASTLDLIEVVPGRLMQREAALQMRALMAEFWLEFGEQPYLAETFRSLATQQHYANTMPKGTYAPPGTSNHGFGTAADIWSGVSIYGSPQSNWMLANAGRFGYSNAQGRATKSKTYPAGEAHHWVYIPKLRSVIATGNELAEMANLYDMVSTILRHQDWHREQNDRMREELTWLRAQVDTEFQKAELNRQMVAEGFTRVDWLRERVDGIVPPTLRMSDAVLAPSVPQTPPPAA